MYVSTRGLGYWLSAVALLTLVLQQASVHIAFSLKGCQPAGKKPCGYALLKRAMKQVVPLAAQQVDLEQEYATKCMADWGQPPTW
jgi:hypothetical protein